MKWVGPNIQIEDEIKKLKATIQQQSLPRWVQAAGVIGVVVAALTGVYLTFIQ